MAEHVANIGPWGARRRRLGGVVWLALSVTTLIALVVRGAPRLDRLWLMIPFGMAAAGFLQSREKT